MNDLPYWIASQLPYYRDQQEATLEEQRKIKEKAANYDKLVNELGYIENLRVMVDKIESEIAEATKHSLEPERQRIHIIRWNAMRELLDAAQNDIIDIRKERDRINQEALDYLRLMSIQKGEEVNG